MEKHTAIFKKRNITSPTCTVLLWSLITIFDYIFDVQITSKTLKRAKAAIRSCRQNRTYQRATSRPFELAVSDASTRVFQIGVEIIWRVIHQREQTQKARQHLISTLSKFVWSLDGWRSRRCRRRRETFAGGGPRAHETNWLKCCNVQLLAPL